MAKVDDSRIRVKRKWKSPSRYRFQFDKIAGAESVPINWNLLYKLLDVSGNLRVVALKSKVAAVHELHNSIR